MGASYLRLNVVVCGVNGENTIIINRLFPDEVRINKRQLISKDDNIFYTARLFQGDMNLANNLNQIKEYINGNFDQIRKTNEYPKNVILYFSDEGLTLQQNIQTWRRITNKINELPEVKLPFINFLSYGDINGINQIQDNVFQGFQDRRKITILRLLRNENENNREINYRKILSYLWEMALILNQKPINKLSKNPAANFFRIRQEAPGVTLNILLTGFSRKGKSTFINMIFDKIATLESPSFLPVTSEVIEFLLPSQPDENNVVKGGLKIFDVPGLIEGTNENMSKIEKLVNKSIENQAYNFDIINYILFFLSPAPNFQHTDRFLNKLNISGIKVIFIINRDRPRNNGMPNTTKQTLIDHLRSRGFNNLVRNNGSNILEVDLIYGVEGRTNEIFRCIHDDIMHGNGFENNVINQILNRPEPGLFTYLRQNFNLFQNITSPEDIIERGNRRANLIKAATIPLIIATGFSPIPFIDIPIFIFLTALMLIKIFKAYGFTVNNEIFTLFFNRYSPQNIINNNQNINNEDGMRVEGKIFNFLDQNFNHAIDENTRFVMRLLTKVIMLRIGITAILGALDFIPIVGFIAAGVINAAINTPFLNNIVNEAKKFLSDKIRRSGARENILNIVQGYRDCVSVLENLRDKNEWTRKIKIMDG